MGCVFKNALREQSREIEPLLEKPGGGADAREHLTRYRENARAVLVRYRALRDRFQTPGVPAGLRATFAFADEYMSLLVEGRTHDLLQRVQALGTPAFAEAETGLAALVIDEIQYRKSRGFPSIVAEDKDNETFVFRQSVLKKFITSALHLVVRTEEEGKGLEQMAMAIGAGIAMVFATTVAFYYQKVYGTLSLGFFAVLVVSYMFKDRLKAVVQHYLQRRLRPRRRHRL
jgi:hypothetical protein